MASEIEIRLSAVVDRPDRRLHLGKRLRGFLGRGAGGIWFSRAGAQLWAEAVAEYVAVRADLAEWRRPTQSIRQVVEGEVDMRGAPLVALYVHYAPRAEVSEMVLHQLATYRALGFAIVFLTMAPDLPAAETMAALRLLCGRIVLRANRGIDFGAWHDAMSLVRGISPGPEELLLVNDSLVGPVRPLAPVLAAMRDAGDGVFGLTENLAPEVHLQSYFLLARGSAVAAMMGFLDRYRITASKRRTIRNGEMALTQAMRAAGQPAMACFGYERVERAALQTETAQARLRALYARLLARRGEDAIGLALRNRPINATHGFWRELVELFGFPFIKTDLLTRNPLRLADTMQWRELVEPAMAAMIDRHLALMARRAPDP